MLFTHWTPEGQSSLLACTADLGKKDPRARAMIVDYIYNYSRTMLVLMAERLPIIATAGNKHYRTSRPTAYQYKLLYRTTDYSPEIEVLWAWHTAQNFDLNAKIAEVEAQP